MSNKKLKKKIFEKYGSYKKFLENADVSQPTLNDIIRERRQPRGRTVFRICDKLDCEPEDIDLKY